ncbi:Stk1 family PASTA domain-containing Ser/Thr kinase [Streptomyces lonarensis]|uniref:non-specific serine/threonine protein kinase n=1 Tax=Streptomyces lonarensis TaxID=700599 RepID=A0A7X6D5G2_9ACTN|nr:Stk1 family PASTA domain-containing Ser/Thr kinase [Streptomyces lonarensis]NJQ08541.1 Stk1 family PASTA domain-containing Ser/Thr kinase [Streptomyces lonarensis]
MDATLQDPLIGHVVDGRYRVDARIAVGGMATVYRALDTRLDRTLALKVMHPSLSTDHAFVERFIREAKSVARLNHPNVVSVTDQSSDGEYVYLAMEYVAGCTLRDVLRESGALQPRAVLDIMEPVLAGLGAAHRAGMVHRDIKPENVLIGDDGRVKVADFGLVRGVDTDTTSRTESLLGTVSYLAPEQIEGGNVGPAADVYACGILLFELLTGVKPHTGDTPAQVLMAHVNRNVPPPSRLEPGIPPELDQLVAQATARRVGRRPADAAALLSQLRSARAGLTDAQLDAVPEGAHPQSGGEDATRVFARPGGAATAPVAGGDRTAVIEVKESGPPGSPAGRGWRTLLDGGPRRTVVAVIAGVLLVLGLGGGLWYVNSGQFLATPGVYDLPQAEAEETLRDAGLRVEVTEGFSATVEAGHVISTDPERGDRVRRNAVVTIEVSVGPELATVPEVEGEELERARELISEAGLTPGRVERAFDEEVPLGAVVSTSPAAGEERRPDAAVELVVSRGPELPVPDVVGEPEGGAMQQLTEAGFEVEVESERVHSEHPEGEVAAQSPEAEEVAGEGDTVTLTISKGPEMVVVPDVRGRSEDEAVEILEEEGFEVEVQRFFLTGTVFNQSVHSGDRAPRGSTITLYVR